PVADVEGDEPELLDRHSGQPGAHVQPDISAACEALAGGGTSGDAYARELERAPDKARSRPSDAKAGQICSGGVREARQPTEGVEDFRGAGDVGSDLLR